MTWKFIVINRMSNLGGIQPLKNWATRDFFHRHFVSAGEIRARVENLVPVASPRRNGPAQTFRLSNGRGTIDLITPAHNHFCAPCNRIRIMSSGEVLACLFTQRDSDANVVRAETSETMIQQMLIQAIRIKPDRRSDQLKEPNRIEFGFRFSVGLDECLTFPMPHVTIAIKHDLLNKL